MGICCHPSAIFVGVQRICQHNYTVNCMIEIILIPLGWEISNCVDLVRVYFLTSCGNQTGFLSSKFKFPDDPVLSGSPQGVVYLLNMITRADVVQEAVAPEFGGMLESFKCRFSSNVVLIGSRNKTVKVSETFSPTPWSDESE